MWFDGPLILSGAIATGAAILSAEAMGADFAYVGSPFIATPEARCSDEYRQAIVEGGAADIVNSALFTGIPGNYLRASIVASGLDPDRLDKAESLPTEFGSEGSSKSKAWRDIWGSGQGIGVIAKVQPAADYVAQLEQQYREARGRLCEA
jgi:nitronate monooxygenase